MSALEILLGGEEVCQALQTIPALERLVWRDDNAKFGLDISNVNEGPLDWAQGALLQFRDGFWVSGRDDAAKRHAAMDTTSAWITSLQRWCALCTAFAAGAGMENTQKRAPQGHSLIKRLCI